MTFQEIADFLKHHNLSMNCTFREGAWQVDINIIGTSPITITARGDTLQQAALAAFAYLAERGAP